MHSIFQLSEEKMNYFDFHCDTVTALADGRATAVRPGEGVPFEKYTQAFAIWLNDETSPDAAFKKAGEYYGFFKEHILSFAQKGFKPFLTLENAVSFGNRLENVSIWKKRGVRAVTLTWNGANALGFGSSFPDGGGLTSFGKAALAEMNRLKIIADVSHINKRGFYDCISLSKAPVIASHSNCAALCRHQRNLDDEQIKALFSVGGLLGICFYPLFLGSGNVFELVYEHVCHALELGGENLLCFGSDFDGAEMDERLNSPKKVLKLYHFLSKKGFDEKLLNKIFYSNAQNFYSGFCAS